MSARFLLDTNAPSEACSVRAPSAAVLATNPWKSDSSTPVSGRLDTLANPPMPVV